MTSVHREAASGRKWIGHDEIRRIRGALSPGAYVARAYREARDHDGEPPPWARKLPNGRWVFDASYIDSDAQLNAETIGVDEAAAILGASRRAVQTWVDAGIIACADSREKGMQRLINRERFIREIPELKKRLQTRAVVGFKRSVETRRRQAGRQEAPAAAAAEEPVADEVDLLEAPRDELAMVKAERAAAIEAALRRACERKAGMAALSAAGKREKHPADPAAVAHSVEERFKTAAESRRRETELAALAATMAERIMNDVECGKMGFIDGLLLFNNLAKAKNVPDHIRARVRKDFFGR